MLTLCSRIDVQSCSVFGFCCFWHLPHFCSTTLSSAMHFTTGRHEFASTDRHFDSLLFIEELNFDVYFFSSSLIFMSPSIEPLGFWEVLWAVGVTNSVVKFIFMGLKCLILILPPSMAAYRTQVSITKRQSWIQLNHNYIIVMVLITGMCVLSANVRVVMLIQY